MKPSFSLNLSHEGIVLLHRSPRGAWTEVGDIALNDPDFGENLSFLRSTAVGLEGKGFGTKLIIPASQILYREIHAPGPGENERRAQILAALEGQTPYEIADLSIDWRSDGAMVHVAVVANETLDEAEEFAVEHRFNPISFVGHAHSNAQGWEPFFGRTDFSYSFLGADADVRDTPPPVPAAVDAQSLFKDGQAREQATAASEPEDPEPEQAGSPPVAAERGNLFSSDDADAASSNIFVEPPRVQPVNKEVQQPTAVAPTSETSQPVSAETGTGNTALEDTASAGAFSSRRAHHGQSTQEITDHPVNKIAPRIALIPQNHIEETGAAPIIGGASGEFSALADSLPEDGPAADVEAHIRQDFLADDSGESPQAGILQPMIDAVKKKARLGAAAAVAGLKSTKSTVFRLKIPSRTGRSFDPEKLAEESGPVRSNGRIRIAAAAVLVFAGVIGAGYYFLVPGQNTAQDSDAQNGQTVSFTRSPARGVRADNPAPARPSDFAATVGRASPNLAQNPALGLVRPERRSVFEGKTDPDAGKPDTAKTATDLSEAELAKIRSTGLNLPTAEELAESGGDEEQQKADAEILAAYKASGALQDIHVPPAPAPNQVRDDIFVAGIDRDLGANDAIILPDFGGGPQDDQPPSRMSPLAPDTVFTLDDQGLVVPTKEGAINPEGILVRLGKPALVPPAKPATEALVPPNPLLARTPKARPETLKTGADAIFVQGHLTLAQLTARRAKPRPISAQTELAGDDTSPSDLAVLTSYQPAARPSDFAKTVEKARVKVAIATPATAPILNSGPVLPTRANVAKEATVKNAINLSRLNLIGVSGTPSKRKALLRMPSGRFVRVVIGDRVDGGRVAAIGANSLSYVKSGRNRVLKIPK